MLAPGGPIEVGAEARELANAITHPPLGPAAVAAGPILARLAPMLDGIPSRAYSWLFWPSIGLLPARVREGYGLPWGMRQRLVATWLVSTWQAWRPMLPPSFRQMPQALARRPPRGRRDAAPARLSQPLSTGSGSATGGAAGGRPAGSPRSASSSGLVPPSP